MNLNGKKWKGRKRMIAIKEKNVITIEFEGHDTLESPMLYQYDKGQKIKFLDVPDGAEVQFSNWATEMTKNKIVVNGQVEIPDILLQENKKILAYLKIINSDSETTIKTVIIPVKARTKPADYIEPEQEKPFRKYVEEKLENAEKLVAEANDKVKVNEECLKQIDIKTEQSVNQIAEVTNGKIKDLDNTTTAKMEDIANVTNAKLGDINNTAQAQIEAINSSAAAAGESQREGINTVASSQISNITNITNQQLGNINNTATSQIELIERKTSIQIDAINNTARGQISAINSTALSQIDAINNTTTNQIKNMTVKYSDMCRTLGIEHEGIMLAKTSYNDSSIPHDIYSIDVSKFKYIEFGKLVRGIYEDTLPAFHISIWLTNLKDDPAPEDVTTGKRYDVSLLNDLQFYVAYQGSGGYEVTVNYKLYNKLEETTEE